MQFSDLAMPLVEKRLTPMCFFRARLRSNFLVAILYAYFDVNMIYIVYKLFLKLF